MALIGLYNSVTITSTSSKYHLSLEAENGTRDFARAHYDKLFKINCAATWRSGILRGFKLPASRS